MRGASVLVLFASIAHAEPPSRYAALGVVAFEQAYYQGSYEGFSDNKLEIKGASAFGLHGEAALRASRHLEFAARLDLVKLYGFSTRDASTPDTLYEGRFAGAIAGLVPTTNGGFRYGADLGLLVGRMASRDDSATGSGLTFSLFLGGYTFAWRPWGLFVDFVALGGASVDGGYSSSIAWIARTSVGAVYAF